jgi:hypothetical protein
MARRWCGVLLVLICAACTRSNRPIELKPAFSDDTVVGELRPSWSVTSDERGNGNGLERRVAVRVDAVNQLSDKLYVRLTKLRLVGPNGPIRIDDATVACALASGETPALLQGSSWIPTADIDRLRALQVDQFTVPLSQRGRAFYREFLLMQRPSDSVAIDAEIATYAAAPACAAAK